MFDTLKVFLKEFLKTNRQMTKEEHGGSVVEF